MEFFKLHPTTYVPEELIDNKKSLIWTERYTPAGDFQLITEDIAKVRRMLPTGSFVSVADSDEAMIVETHQIRRDDEGVPELVVSGRSVETFLENRDAWSPSSYHKEVGEEHPLSAVATRVKASRPATRLSAYIIYMSVVSAWSHDRPADLLPNVVVTMATNSTYPNITSLDLEKTDTYSAVMTLLKNGDVGLRTIRPRSSGNILTYPTGAIDPVVTANSNIGAMRFHIYDGVIRSSVILDENLGHFDNSDHLWTTLGVKNTAFLRADDLGGILEFDTNIVTGWNRRMARYDAKGSISDHTKNVLWEAGEEIKKTKKPPLQSLEVSSNIPYVYGTHYNLGDRVMVSSTYEPQALWRVTEYVRVDDEEGPREYPTLSRV